MGRIRRVELSELERAELEQGYRQGKSPAYRRRCQMILLKSQGRSSQEVARILGGCEVVVNTWLDRYQHEGLAGLQTRPGRGRTPILNVHSQGDLEAVREAVAHNRQRLSVAKAQVEEALGKRLCQRTLRRFVKKTVRDLSGCGAVPAASQSRRCISSSSNACTSSRD